MRNSKLLRVLLFLSIFGTTFQQKVKIKVEGRTSFSINWLTGYFGKFPTLFPNLYLRAQDHWFSDDCPTCNPGDWKQEQEMCKAGYDRGNILLVVHDMQDLLRDAADLARDYVEIPLQTLKFIYCLVLSFTFQDITFLERPGDNKADRFAPRFKRSRVINLFFDSTYSELKAVRCFKRWLPEVIRIATTLVKYFFYFLPIWDKFTVRLGLMVGKIVVTTIRKFIPFLMLTDAQAFDFYYGAWIGTFWFSFWRSVSEFWMDCMASYNEEMFVEATQWTRTFGDWDNRITSMDLWMYSNATFVHAANIHDDYKWDYHSRIDAYYCDFLAVIQSNELFEIHDNMRDREILLTSKEEFCQAMWLPVGNPFVRTELKIAYTKRMVKTDGILDLAEFRCITIYAAMNIADNTNPLRYNIEVRLRMVHRLDDMVRIIDMVDPQQVDDLSKQDLYLEGIIELARCAETILENVPEFKTEIGEIVKLFRTKYEKFVGKTKIFGGIVKRRRANGEVKILSQMVGAVVNEN